MWSAAQRKLQAEASDIAGIHLQSEASFRAALNSELTSREAERSMRSEPLLIPAEVRLVDLAGGSWHRMCSFLFCVGKKAYYVCMYVFKCEPGFL